MRRAPCRLTRSSRQRGPGSFLGTASFADPPARPQPALAPGWPGLAKDPSPWPSASEAASLLTCALTLGHWAASPTPTPTARTGRGTRPFRNALPLPPGASLTPQSNGRSSSVYNCRRRTLDYGPDFHSRDPARDTEGVYVRARVMADRRWGEAARS